MIDIQKLADDPAYRNGMIRKGASPDEIDAVLVGDEDRLKVLRQVESLRAEQNIASKAIGQCDPADRGEKIKEATRIKAELAGFEDQLAGLERTLREALLLLPNPAHVDVPDGGEEDSQTIREVGEQCAAPRYPFAEFGEKLGWVESVKAVEMSGSRFVYFMREAVQLEFALMMWTMNKLISHGFSMVIPPVLVREHAMVEAGFFPTDMGQVYETTTDELILVGTSEVPLSALHRHEILNRDSLPLRYAGFSSCFRREVGTYGKDMSGTFRVHQFDKMEMFVFSDPAHSWEIQEQILAIEEEIVSALEIPYRVVNVASGDLGPAAAKKYDIEGWLPSEQRYREMTSCSNYLDYSARRLGTRIKTDSGKSEPVHTLNGTAATFSRWLCLMLENYQDADGSFVVPEVLRPFMGMDRINSA